MTEFRLSLIAVRFVQANCAYNKISYAVGVTIGGRTTVFEVATPFFVTLTRNSNGGASVRDAIAELVDLNYKERR